MEVLQEGSEKCCCSKCTNFAKRLSSEQERSLFLNGFSNYSRNFVCSILPAHNNYLPSHKVEKQPSLHYLSKARFDPEDEQRLEEIISFLCHSGYDINQKDVYTQYGVPSFPKICHGFTALLAAVSLSDVPLVKCLLRNGAQPDILDANGVSALHWAVFSESVSCFKILIEAGALAGKVETSENVPPILHTAIFKDQKEMVEYLLEQGLVDLTQTAYYKASSYELYLDKICVGNSWNSKNLESANVKLLSLNPFRAAILQEKEEMVKLLFKYEEVRNATSIRDLNLCMAKGYTRIAWRILPSITGNELVKSKFKREWPLLCLPTSAFQDKNRVKWTEKLILHNLKSGWDINNVSRGSFKDSDDSVDVGSWFRRICTDWTISYGERPETMSNFTLLHLACYSGAPLDMIQLLVKKGADVNMRTKGDFKVTPLLLAIFLGLDDVAMYLVENGADLNIKGALKGIVFTDLADYLENSYKIPAKDNQYGSFSAVELVLRYGYCSCNGGRLFQKMIDTGLTWHGADEFQLAVEGGHIHNVWKVLEHCDSEKLEEEEMTWLSWESSLFKVPSLLYLLQSTVSHIREVTSDDVSALASIMNVMVHNYGYDCNLIDCPEGECEGIEKPIIFLCLDLDLYNVNNPSFTLVKTLLEFDHVNVNVTNWRGENPVEYVLNRFSTFEKGGYEVCRMLINHGVDVSGIKLQKSDCNRRIFHPKLIKLLFTHGAKLDKQFFNPTFEELRKSYEFKKFKDGEVRTYMEDVKRLEAEYEKGLGITNLRLLCRRGILKLCENVGQWRMAMEKLPRELREELDLWCEEI